MYLQITTRCNMHCDHCCYRCEETGEDMSLEIFEKALSYDDETATIGGGEPTVREPIQAGRTKEVKDALSKV